MLDIVFINPGDRKAVFQDLGKDLTAIEPPFQIASYASYLRNEGFNVAIIDANALNITPQETAQKIKELNPLLVAIIVYGNQPSASTQNMTISGCIATTIKNLIDVKIVLGGLHPSALPKRTIEEENVDFVIEGEEQIPLKELLQYIRREKSISEVSGIWYKTNNQIKNNPKPKLIDDLDKYLPIAAWDLLPMDIYRAHNWHCFDDISNRSPYGAIYTSLGCPYKCSFCCINAPFGGSGIRYRTPELVVEELELLNRKYNIKNIKIIDEMFVLDERHYMKIVDLIIEKELDLNIWAYARVDTVKERTLKKLKQAGFNWLALGIESASSDVRDGASKKMRVNDIKSIVDKIHNAGIKIIANYIFGLPDDTHESMQETLNMAKELNTEFGNFYCAMAYPGSQLYNMAINNGWKLPQDWLGYSQHSYNIQPLPSKYLTAKEILQFRDDAFHEYNENPKYLKMLEDKFGVDVRKHMEELTKIRLKRQLLTKNIILFGASQSGIIQYTHYKKFQNINIIAFCDNSKDKIGQVFCNLPIISPDTISSLDYDEIVIASMFDDEIHEQLINLDVEEYKIIRPISNLSTLSFGEGDTLRLAQEILFFITNLFNKNHIKYHIDHGTLLGIIRDNKMLPWDVDVDIASFVSEKDAIVKLLNDNIDNYKSKYCKNNNWKYKLTHENNLLNTLHNKKELLAITLFNDVDDEVSNNVHLDILIKYIFEDKIYWSIGNKKLETQYDTVYPFKSISFRDHSVNVPNKKELYLTNLYNNWKQIDKQWSFNKYNNINMEVTNE